MKTEQIDPKKLIFNPGESYKGRSGWFVVVAAYDHKVSVRYEQNGNDFDGKGVLCDLDFLQRMVANVMREHSRVIPYATNGDYNKRYFQTLGFLAKHCTITAQVPPHSQKSFDSRYFNIKNRLIDPAQKDSHYNFASEKTWSPTIRIRFQIPNNMNLLDFAFWPFQTEVRELENNWVEINSVNWGWELLEMGFELGKDHNASEILKHVPSEYREYFMKGLHS